MKTILKSHINSKAEVDEEANAGEVANNDSDDNDESYASEFNDSDNPGKTLAGQKRNYQQTSNNNGGNYDATKR